MSKVIKTFPAKVIQVGDEKDRVLRFMGTDESVDRHNTIVKADGWVLDNFKLNPIFPWAHDLESPPIGKVLQINPEDGGDTPGLSFDVEFADKDTYPFADVIYKLYQKGFLRMTSVGFQPMTIKQVTDPEEATKLGFKNGYGIIYEKQELVELSAVPLGSNPNALNAELAMLAPACARAMPNADLSKLSPEDQGKWFAEQFAAIRKAVTPPSKPDAQRIAEAQAKLDALPNPTVAVPAEPPESEAKTIPAASEARAEGDELGDEAQAHLADATEHLNRAMESIQAALQTGSDPGEEEDEEESGEEELSAPSGVTRQDLEQLEKRFMSLFGDLAKKSEVIGLSALVQDLAKRIGSLESRLGEQPQSQENSYIDALIRDNLDHVKRIESLVPKAARP